MKKPEGYPVKNWIMYLDNHLTMSEYDGCIVQVVEKKRKSSIVKVVGGMGWNKAKEKRAKDAQFEIENKNLKIGLLTKSDIDFMLNNITDFTPSKYMKDKKYILCVSEWVGFQKTLDIILKEKGKLNEEIIEKMFASCKTMFHANDTELSISPTYSPKGSKKITALEALKTFGLPSLASCYDRGVSGKNHKEF
jgi:hypothetical protein